ncbi:uncharacterized protein LOC134716794 [Mytilus trossulus]|uniref:uncharacterized protein LOC134716794 n=1 Tax=Mytilus trossulus TaxID=6551 RepID=UPI0030052DBC
MTAENFHFVDSGRNLKNNKILEMQSNAFRYLTGVEIIHLDDNSLQTIKSETFVNMTKLNILSLDSNGLICDCRIHSFYLWLLQQTQTNAHGAVCSNLNGQMIKDIPNVEECKETTPATTEILDNEPTTSTILLLKITKEIKMTSATTGIVNIEQTTDARSSKHTVNNQGVITIPILLGIIGCTVSVMAFITIIIYIVIKARCKNKQEGTIGFDHTITPNRLFSEYDIPQEMI